MDESISADDSVVGRHSVTHLQTVLPRFFGKSVDAPWRLVSSWSGIMGYSADGLPLVGRLPSALTGRTGEGEWIAAAFNGYGMANCLMSGERLAFRSIWSQREKIARCSHVVRSGQGTGREVMGLMALLYTIG